MEPYDGPAASALVRNLLIDLNERYGPGDFEAVDPITFAPPTGIFLVAWDGEVPAACGGFKRVNAGTAEVKRMYVAPAHRRQGLARGILTALEERALKAGYQVLRLETGTLQPEAIELYRAAGFEVIPPFPPYAADPTSVCFAKELADHSTFSA